MARAVGIEPTSHGFGDRHVSNYDHTHNKFKFLEDWVRIELTTNGLKVRCSTTELPVRKPKQT